MSDKTLEILIKTLADLAGAKAAEAQLEAVINKGKFLGQNLEKEQQQLKVVQNALADYTEKNKDAGAEIDKLEIGHRALHKIMEIIGRETAPEVGQALSAALYGPAGAIIALGVGVEYLSSVLQSAREQAEALANIQWDAAVDSAKELAASYDDLAASLAKASKDQDPVKHKYSEMLAVLEAHIAAHKQILESMEKEALAAVGDDPQKRAAIQAQFAFLQKTTASAGEQAKFALAQKEIDTRKKEQGNLEADAKKLAGTVASQENDPAYLKAQAENKGKDFGALSQGFEAAQKEIESMGGMEAARAASRAFPTELGTSSIDAAIQKVEDVEKFKANQKIIADTEASITRNKKAQADASDKSVANQTAITDSETELQKNKKVFLQSTAGDEINTAIGLSKRAAAGGQLNPSELGFLQTAGTLVAGQSVSSQQAEQMFIVASKNHQVLDNFLTRLFAALAKIPDFKAYENRLDQLESRLKDLKNK